MLEIRQVDTNNRQQKSQFVQFHYDLYKGDPNWVPPFRGDVNIMLDRKKHPFYDHSEAEFFTAWKDGKMVGRIAGLHNNSFNQYHNEQTANFFLFDSINDQEVANGLFDAVVNWAKQFGAETLIGPKGFSLFDGYGMLVEGYEYRQMMNMSAYNYPYYKTLLENYGFGKVNDFLSMAFNLKEFYIPEKVNKVAEIVKKRGILNIHPYNSRKEITADALNIARLYAKSFEKNWEYFPLSDREFKFLVDNVIKMVDPKMVKFIKNQEGALVGFLLAFPDISAAMQRHNGNLTPALIIDILLETRRTKDVSLNGIGILPEYHRKGGDALMITELYSIMHSHVNFERAEATQMAESAKEIQSEMVTFGLHATKRHRVFVKSI